jgi:hypothetical protein
MSTAIQEQSLAVVASTGINGFTLQNATPTILTWNTPNDGNLHRCLIVASLDVTSAETGGQITVTYTLPNGGSTPHNLFSAGTGAGIALPVNIFNMCVGPNTSIVIAQASALSAGAAIMWADILGL